MNLNGVIKDGYQIARASSRLKYCLQIRYQLRASLPSIGLYQSLRLSVRILHRPTLEARNTELRYALLDASRMQMYRSSITVESGNGDLKQVAKRKNVVDIVDRCSRRFFFIVLK